MCKEIFTARVRSTTGGYVFTLYTICGGGEGGYPIQLMGGTPFPGLDGGYPIQLMGGTPFPGLDGGYPIQLMGGVPLPSSRQVGVPPSS